MSKWLASVQSLQEAQTLLPVLPDILDMKNPSQGALGALSVATVTDIVRLIDGRCLTSATVGDLPMSSQQLTVAITNMADSGVDYVKIGIFPDDDLTNCLSALAETVKNLSTPVIAVLFADHMPSINCIPMLKQAGFAGVMVDTAFKNGQHLTDHWQNSELVEFVSSVKQHDLLCGLAGALRIEDIERLKLINADYLGFRSALCVQRQRTASLSLERVKLVQQAIVATSSAKVA
ncbi:hypothetical protein A9Q78_05345 [Methylophaga sp. 41_12_T18]|nr:hypothetical protein A9Q78_05345 [Methylophaga sp. 41_12_T18]